MYITNLKFLLNSYMMKFVCNIISDNDCNKEILNLHNELISTLNKFYVEIENKSDNGENKQIGDKLHESQSSN